MFIEKYGAWLHICMGLKLSNLKHCQAGDGSISEQNEDKGLAINLHAISRNETRYVGSRFNT